MDAERAQQANRVIPIPLSDGKVVEAVFYGSGTLCISTQVGCAVGCPFCASGSRGLFRNLSLEEVHHQLEVALSACRPERLTLSGIGEPLHNWPVTKQLLEQGELPVSLTTTGSPLKRLPELMQLPHNGVMLSLHSAIPATYQSLVPKGPGCQPLFQALLELWPQLSRTKRRKIGVNVLVIEGRNDGEEELEALAQWMQPFAEATLHLLLCNPVGHAAFHSPSEARMEEIHGFFRRRDIHCRRANRWRRKEDGGCGTLLVRGLESPGYSSEGSSGA